MTVEIHGFCEERFSPIADAFGANFDEGLELGGSLAATWRGKTVVDLWGGWADREKTKPWQADTIVRVHSTTKVPMAIAAIMLVDRGLLDLDAPVARYWPAFAEGGKAAVTIRDAFTHQAGVPGFDPPVTFEAMNDWDGICARLAAEPHWFGGERRTCYHSETYGFPLGEAMRRVDGRRPAQFFREELADKADIDFQMALTSKSDLARVAEVLPPTQFAERPPGSLADKVLHSVGRGDFASWARQSADIPADSGYGNGRSLARLGAILANGGVLDGVRYLSSAIVEEAAREQVYGEDPLFGWVKWGLGLFLHCEEFRAPTPTCLAQGGLGGSWASMDPRAQFSFGYAPNDFRPWAGGGVGPRELRFRKALHRLLPTL